VGRDDNGKKIVTSGLRITPGEEMEELPASFFNSKEYNEES
jgi:hypothetical protein